MEINILHRPIILEHLVHFESLPDLIRLVILASPLTFFVCSLKVLHQDGLVVRMRSFIVPYTGSEMPPASVRPYDVATTSKSCPSGARASVLGQCILPRFDLS